MTKDHRNPSRQKYRVPFRKKVTFLMDGSSREVSTLQEIYRIYDAEYIAKSGRRIIKRMVLDYEL